MHIHILGICGTFMGGIALIARAAGHRVTGCDANVYPPMSTQLTDQGIDLVEGFGAEQMGLRPDAWVIGNVVTRGNPLMEAILDAGERYVSGPQWLAENVLVGKWVLAVAGTHGKTTTTSMLAWILEAAGLRPGFLVGGVPANFGVSARLSDAAHFVIEADEYDTAFFDKRSKFVHYRARTALLNNLEFDHADIFADLAAIETQFHHFVRTVPRSGRVLLPPDDAALGRVIERGCWASRETFGPQGVWDSRVVPGGFEVLREGRVAAAVQWTIPGEHNRRNALGAIAAAYHAGVAVEDAAAALGTFRSVRRRLELRGTASGIAVFDDFAHHPTAIAVTLAALKEQSEGRLIAVLEPRSNTMKLGVMKDQLAPSLALAERVFCYTQGLGWDPSSALAPLGDRARCVADLATLVDAIAAEARSGDRVVVMSNGGFGGIHEKLLDRLARK
jgi:UDP-N-acetylmuramate: L-alanyl-gamma-D-glutamyl-meso-diaminopimelate ligase